MQTSRLQIRSEAECHVQFLLKMEESTVAKWFSGQHIFITGATGFLGKVLVEKLLRSCPEIATINLLVRPKKEQSPQERIEQFLQVPLFDKIRQINPNHSLLKKIRVIPGDISKANLGLNEEDLLFVRKNINVVFNSAACVRFDQPLIEEIKGNTTGTVTLLDLAKTFEKLKVFVHVSTAYCHCDRIYTEERIYDTLYDPREIVRMADWMNEDLFDTISPKLLDENPNTYTYTKNLTEALLKEYTNDFPIVLARPSIVSGTWKEPIPGWVDTVNGIAGFCVAAGKGMLHTIQGNPDARADLVPVDYVVNAIIISAWKKATTTKNDQALVVNVTADKENRLHWSEVLDVGRKYLINTPLEDAVFYPCGTFQRYYYINWLTHIFIHVIPALMVDLVLRALGKKPFFYDLQIKIYEGISGLSYFLSKSWHFEQRNLKAIADTLNSKDRKVFFTDISGIEWEEYFRNWTLGLKQYLLKEKPENISKAKNNMRRNYLIYLGMKMFAASVTFWMLYKKFCPTARRYD